ncbi:alpha/beta hydrolase [Sediminibacterium sp.]|jgi:acetyl esterase/lipase|uniref:alpha/beta hydrolase n=1 Tax=Sediminibacterium sp. TaxID=1917865 RepID=UPI0025FA623E|nr:alpha/beta hydrolase [Sediminibacterium sp.]MBW0178496.1 alpha/beta hydrolase [Sediminibacterium sp.]
MKKLLLGISLLLLASIKLLAQDVDSTYKPVPVPQGFTKQLNVIYKQVKDWIGRVDIYLPPVKDKPVPVVINIHGGAWRKGAKEAQGGFNTYFKLGFAVANVEYRLSSQGVAPAAIEDVRCVMQYLINHADSLHIDVTKIIFAGSSAGAHLALMAGLTANINNPFDKDCPVSSKTYKIAAIIAQSTPSVLYSTRADGQLQVLKDGAVYEWFGGRKDDENFAQKLSPVTYVSKDNPPIFLSHGDADGRVPYQQSVDLDAKLTKAGVKHVFITIPGGGHGGYSKEKQDEIKNAITEFLKENVINK